MENIVTLEQAADLCNRAGMRYISYGKKLTKGDIADETEVKHDMFLMYLDAAKSGLGRALYNLGVCYHFGIGVGVDVAEAQRCYEQALAAGYYQALVYLARIFAQGENGVKNQKKADELLEQAAQKGNPVACFMLGGTAANQKDTSSALTYFATAAHHHTEYSHCVNMCDAQSGKDYEACRDNVGSCLSKCLFFAAYLTLLVVRKKEDFATAYGWLTVAFEEMQMPESTVVLAHCHTYGEGTPQDFDAAERFVKLAEEMQIHGAEDARDDLEETKARINALKK